MITDLHIENFRRFRRLDIDRLCPVNLLVGANGVGKTTVLEALEAFSQGHGCLTSLVRLLVERQEAARPPAAESQLEDPAQGIAGALAHLFNREAPDLCLRLEGGRTDRAAPAIRTVGGVAGLIIDADQEAASRRWQSIRDLLARTSEDWGPKLDLYPEFPQDGLVLDPPKGNLSRIGIWIMPDNRSQGMLEDWLLRMLESHDDDLVGHAGRVVDALPKPRRFSPNAESKARLYSWLAWQAEPGTPPGRALFQQQGLPVEAPAVFLSWIRRLFRLAAPTGAGP